MPSLMELVERVNKGELVDAEQLEMYEESPNSAEKFLAHHAHAMLELRAAQQHMLASLEALDYSDQKVLNQFVAISGFLGMTEMRAGPVIRFGSCAISRREYALGLEAIQNGVAYDLQHGGAYTGDRENCLFVAAQYDRAAQAAGWTNDQPIDWSNKQTKIAWVVSSIADEDASARTITGLARHLDAKRCKLSVYSTEAGVRRDKPQFVQTTYAQSSSKRGSQTIESLTRQKVTTWTAPTDGDIIAAATELANQLIRDKIDVVIFDATQADPIAAMVADWDVGRTRINYCRRTPLYAAGIQSVCYTDQARFQSDQSFWQRRGIESRFVLEGIDAEENLGPAPQRNVYGIPDNAIVLATSGQDLDRTISDEYVNSMIDILRAHPHAICLLIGEAELSWQKRKFEAAGVGKRVGYAGKRRDLPGFLRIADIYAAEFPNASTTGILQAMSVERPVVAMNCEWIGNESLSEGADAAAYVERISKLIREPQYRMKIGRSMRNRVEQQYAFNQTARQIEQICEQLNSSQNTPLAEAA